MRLEAEIRLINAVHYLNEKDMTNEQIGEVLNLTAKEVQRFLKRKSLIIRYLYDKMKAPDNPRAFLLFILYLSTQSRQNYLLIFHSLYLSIVSHFVLSLSETDCSSK